jgi:hypothetical protein
MKSTLWSGTFTRIMAPFHRPGHPAPPLEVCRNLLHSALHGHVQRCDHGRLRIRVGCEAVACLVAQEGGGDRCVARALAVVVLHGFGKHAVLAGQTLRERIPRTLDDAGPSALPGNLAIAGKHRNKQAVVAIGRRQRLEEGAQ